MITAADFIKLPYTSDLTEGGIAYAIRSLQHVGDGMSGSVYSRLRHIVAGIAVELAFRRYLGENDIPFIVKNPTAFSEPARYDVSLGGHRCDIHTYLTSKRNQIIAMRSNPALVLRAPALIPEGQFASANHSEHDLNLFAFLLGLTTNSPEEIQKAVNAGQRSYLIHPMQPNWSQPQIWAPLGRLALKSECIQQINIEIGGLDRDRNFIVENVTLDHLQRIYAVNNYYSLVYIHSSMIPDMRIGIHCANKGEPYIIHPHQWGNIWVYGMEIWMGGYMAREEFRRKSSTIFAGSRVFQYSKTQTSTLSVLVCDLHSLEDLFSRVKDWNLVKRMR